MHPFLTALTTFFSSKAPTMKFADLEASYLSTSTDAGTAADQLAAAQFKYDTTLSASKKSIAAFASAISAKGGEVSNTTTGLTYRSADGLSLKSSKLVTMDDDAPEPAPAPVEPAPAPVEPAPVEPVPAPVEPPASN